jgi:hypothetical protein
MCINNIEMTGTFKKTIGSKAEVWHQVCEKTVGGLKKKDLMKHKGRIISRKKHLLGKKAIKHLFALGYKPKKGTFKLMRKSMVDGRKHKKGSRRHSRKRRGSTNSQAAVPVVTPATNGAKLPSM